MMLMFQVWKLTLESTGHMFPDKQQLCWQEARCLARCTSTFVKVHCRVRKPYVHRLILKNLRGIWGTLRI